MAIENVWVGGTVGALNSVLLRGIIPVGDGDNDAASNELLGGTHNRLAVDVERGILLPDGTKGRRFHISVPESEKKGTLKLDVPETGFSPVWRVVHGELVHLEVLKALRGEAIEWIVRAVDIPGDERHYRIFSRSVNEPIDPDVFAFKVPDGYITSTLTGGKTVISNPDGRRRELSAPDVEVPLHPQLRRSWQPWILQLFGPALIILGLWLWMYVSGRSRRDAI